MKIFITNNDDEVISNLLLIPLTQNGALYHLTLINSVGGIDTFDSCGNYAKGDVITIIADAAPGGQVFDKWVSADEVIFADAYSKMTTFTMPGYAVSIEATYKRGPDEAEYQTWPGGIITQTADWEPTIVFNKPVDGETLAGITVWRRTAGGGMQEIVINPQVHQKDDKVVFAFAGWYEGDTKNENAGATYPFTVIGDRTLEARFNYVGGGSSGGSGGSAASATLNVKEAKFNRSLPEDVVVMLSPGSYTFCEIKNINKVLVHGKDYSVSGNTYTIKADYLASLKDGKTMLIFNMDGGINPAIK